MSKKTPAPADRAAKKPPLAGLPLRNRFGDPADTLYAGGTPLLDERTGKTVTKREHQRRQPKPR